MLITWYLFWGFRSCHLVDHRVNNTSVGPFIDNDKPNVTNLNAFTIMIEDSHCQGTGRLACHPMNPWHSGGQQCRSTKWYPITTSFIVYLLDAWRTAVSQFPLIPPFLSRWVKATLTRYTRLVTFYQERFGYVISIKSAQKRTFSVFRMIPTPTHMGQENIYRCRQHYIATCTYM